MGAKGFTDEYLKTRSATFGELTKNLLAQDAKSAYKQAAIIMLRNAFADLELCGGEKELDTESNCSIPVVMPRLTIQGIEFNKFDKDNETEIVVPSHGYDDDNHIWLTADELKQIGKFYFNEA